MKIALYLDVIFVINFCADWICLSATAYLQRQNIRWGRVFAGAIFGAGMLLPFLTHPAWLSGVRRICVSMGISMGAVGIAFGRKGGWIRKWMLSTTIQILIGGIMNGLCACFRISVLTCGTWMLFLLGGTGACMFLTLSVSQRLQTRRVQLAIGIRTKNGCQSGLVLLDTGNRLRDGLFGKPVIVLSASFLMRLFTDEENRIIEDYRMKNCLDYQSLVRLETQRRVCFHEITYQSVGNPSGRLLCCLVDEVFLPDVGIRLFRQPVAIAEDGLFEGKAYNGLLFADGNVLSVGGIYGGYCE